MIKIDKEKALLYGTTVTSVVALLFALNAQRRIAYVEYDVVDKHETLVHMIGQAAQRLHELQNPQYTGVYEGERGYFE